MRFAEFSEATWDGRSISAPVARAGQGSIGGPTTLAQVQAQSRRAEQGSSGSDIGSMISSMLGGIPGMGDLTGGGAGGGGGTGGGAGGGTGGGAGGGTNTTDPGAPSNPGRAGNVRFARGALTTLNGQQSRMTSPSAGRQMQQDTIPRAQRMASFFGGSITVNDAIAKAGTSRESQTQGSQHFQGRALDISTAGMNDQQKLRLVNAAQRAGFSGFGFGSNILHVDTGPRRHWAYGNATYGGRRVADLGAAVRSGRTVA